jgi:hypothetical protein
MADARAIIPETDLEALEQQSSFHERDPQYCRRRGRGFGSSVPVNLSHAKVAREKPTEQPAKPKPAPAAPITKAPAPIGRFLRDYADIVGLCRAQADKLEISRHETDRLAGLPDGHTGHVLAPSFSKLIGPAYLLPLFETLGIRLIAVEDPELIARTLARRAPRDSSHMRAKANPSGDAAVTTD